MKILVIIYTLLLCKCCSLHVCDSPITRSVEKGLDIYYKDSISVLDISDSVFRMQSDINLNGMSFVLPDSITIIPQGGRFINGRLIGNNTSIKGVGELFENVAIEGIWIVPFISTSMFSNLRYDNSLKDVIALSNPDIHNNIIIEDGIYNLKLKHESDAGITLTDNTDIYIKGTLTISPNNYARFYMIDVCGENINIHGGTLIGEKSRHLGKDGQWGMGINICHSNSCIVSNVSISNCWGDCIYVGKQSKDITIANCVLENARRQGISVTCAENVLVANTKISNIKGSAPEYGIDLEPNSNEKVSNVLLTNIDISNSVGGILCYGMASNATVSNITINNCSIQGCSSPFPLRIQKSSNIKLQDVSVVGKKSRILFDTIDSLTSIRTNIYTSKKDSIKYINCHYIEMQPSLSNTIIL